METNAATADVSAAKERMSGDLRALVGDAQRLLDDAARYDDAQIARVKRRLSEEIDRLRHHVDDAEAAIGLRLREGARRTDEAVHGHPYVAMGAAAFAGLLVGALLGRR